MTAQPEPARKSQQDQWKRAAAAAAVEQVADGMILGLGSGSTAQLAVEELGKRVHQGLRVIGVSTSEKTADQARQLGISLSTLAEYPKLDLTIDGADEAQPGPLSLIKGGGGNLLREKIIASASRRLTIVVDQTKVVEKLGAHPLPIEVVPFGWQSTEQRLLALGAKPVLRTNAGGSTYLTDGGHYILDCSFGLIQKPEELAKALDDVVGVVEHGLFIGLASQVLVAGPEGVKTLPKDN